MHNLTVGIAGMTAAELEIVEQFDGLLLRKEAARTIALEFEVACH